MAAETLRWKNVDLPTFDKLGVPHPQLSEAETKEIANQWLQKFQGFVANNDIDGILIFVRAPPRH